MITASEVDKGFVDGNLPEVVVRGAAQHPELMKLLERAAIAILPSGDKAMPMLVL